MRLPPLGGRLQSCTAAWRCIDGMLHDCQRVRRKSPFLTPRLLHATACRYADIALCEIHEAFAAQVLFHLEAVEHAAFVRSRAGIDIERGHIDPDHINPNGSVALGHPFGAAGARIMSQAVKELANLPQATRAIVSICADGGQGSAALLQRD